MHVADAVVQTLWCHVLTAACEPLSLASSELLPHPPMLLQLKKAKK